MRPIISSIINLNKINFPLAHTEKMPQKNRRSIRQRDRGKSGIVEVGAVTGTGQMTADGGKY